MAEERRGKLDETLKLYQLQGEIDDLEQWIAEKEVVAGSQDIGQDLAQVEVHFSVVTINSIRCSFRTLFFRLVQIRNLKDALIRALSLIDCTTALRGDFLSPFCLRQSIPPDDIQGLTDKSGSTHAILLRDFQNDLKNAKKNF